MRGPRAFGILLAMGHEFNDARSLAYHRVIADRLARDPDLVGVAARRVLDWQQSASVAPYYADRWMQLLSLPLSGLTAAILDSSEQGCALRQVSPFAGVLSPRERWDIWRQTRAVKIAS